MNTMTMTSATISGDRYIVLHAGNENGFINNASLVFKSGSKKGDYHDNMNRKNFENWFKNQLIPNLSEKSLIIMDNASYHSGLLEEIPQKSWTKQKLITWLRKQNYDFEEKAMKDEIWTLVCSKLIPQKKYYLDEYVKSFGHKILRLPPYHCQYNPIEMVWSECKRKYDEHMISLQGTAVEVLTTWERVLREMPAEHWKNYIQHVNKLINHSWNTIKYCDVSDIEPLIITEANNDSDSELSSELSDSEIEDNLI